ncbi:MAG: hypothetical protein JWO36_7361 [Myxococcales bacterium]|nr:hypothetical protein [Myxococcales bacterium]
MVRLAARADRRRAVIDEVALRAESGQIENLLGELRELVTPPAWQRIDQVLRRVTGLYGAGLSHALDHARDAGADTQRLSELVIEDDLLASLLVLHGLHPLTVEQRIARALAAVETELGLVENELTIASLENGVLELHSTVALGGGAMSARVAEGVIRKMIEGAAPEVTSIRITGLPAPRDPSLVQLRTRREAP